MSTCRLTSTFVFGLLTLVCTATAEPLASSARRHCVVKVAPAHPQAPQPIPLAVPECYPTFRDAIFFATGGSVLLPGKQPLSVQLDMLEQELKAKQAEMSATSTYVISVDYQHSNYGGATIIWESTGPCTPLSSWYKNSMPSGWNDVVSSTRAYVDCNKNVLFEHANRTGAKFTCRPNCSGLGGFNDKTSSREWHHICEAVPGQWSGCSGFSGCEVCSDLLANYPCYFQNHPNCVSAGACGGFSYTCSDACPAPTQADTCNNTCTATASCASAGGGTVSCTSQNGNCSVRDNCWASCDGELYYCPNPPSSCPL